MADPDFLTSAQFADALTRQNLQISRLVHAAIMTGPVLFLIAVLAFSVQLTGELPPAPSSFDLMNILSMVHGVLALLALLAAQFLSGTLFSPDRLKQDTESVTVEMQAAKCVALQRAASIGRLAVLEGVSLFGLAVCFVGVTNRVIQAEPAYWFNAASTGLFLIYAASVFPTREYLLGWFERTFGRT
jgi:hypothetical protein